MNRLLLLAAVAAAIVMALSGAIKQMYMVVPDGIKISRSMREELDDDKGQKKK